MLQNVLTKLMAFSRILSTGWLLLCIIFVSEAWAQQDPQFTQYMFNQLYINPAHAGLEKNARFSLIHRSQWAGYNASFNDGGTLATQVFTANVFIAPIKSGVGIQVMNDQLGPVTNRDLQLSYAYHVRLPNAKLSFGVRGGLYNISLDFNRLRALDPNDPLILTGVESQTKFDLAGGVYYLSRRFFGSVSVNHLLNTKFDFGSRAIQNRLAYTGYAMAGYRFEVGRNWTVTPSFLVKTDLKVYSFDVSTLINYNERYWGGVAYRYQDAVSVLLGADIPYRDNSIRIGYAFDYVLEGQPAKRPTSHEIFISYAIPMKEAQKKPVIRTPRFRFD